MSSVTRRRHENLRAEGADLVIKLKSLFGRKRGTPRERSTSVSADAPLVRWIGPLFTVFALLFGLGCVIAGKINLSKLDQVSSSDGLSANSSTQPVLIELGDAKSLDTIRIATFHIDRLCSTSQTDPSPSATSDQISILARIVNQFDVIAVQGIEGGSPVVIQRTIDLIKRSGGRYISDVSTPVGRAALIQSYAFIWDESRIRLIPDSTGIVQDSRDRLMFEPMYASFETRVGFTEGRRPFRFTLINALAQTFDRGNGELEVNVLDDVFVSVRNFGYQTAGEEDCILLGDLGVGADRLFELGQIPGVRSMAGRVDVTEHILFDPTYTAEYTGRSGFTDFRTLLGITNEQALSISTRFPHWAEFSVQEIPMVQNVAANR